MEEDKEQLEYDEQCAALNHIYDLVMQGGGYVTINQRHVEDPNTLQSITRIKAVAATPQIQKMYKAAGHSQWNKMCDLINRLCETRYYKEWIYDDTHNLIGFLVFRAYDGEEIKVKHFFQWKKLLGLVERTGRGRDGKKIAKRGERE